MADNRTLAHDMYQGCQECTPQKHTGGGFTECDPQAAQGESSSAMFFADGDSTRATNALDMMPIAVQLLNGGCLELQVPKDARVFEVKQIISELELIGTPEDQHLMLDTEELADAESLKSYGICSGSCLSLVRTLEYASSRRQNPIVGKVLSAMEMEWFNPTSAHFQLTWKAQTVPEVSDDEFDRLVEKACGVNEDPKVYSDFVRILGFWSAAAEKYGMMNLQILQRYDPGMKRLKHELYLEMIKEACSSAHAVTSPEVAFFFAAERGRIHTFDLFGKASANPFSSNLRNSLELNDVVMKACDSISFQGVVTALWRVAQATSFDGLRTFNPSDWTGIISPSEPVTVHEEDVVPLLHVQTQMSAGICPVVIDKELGKSHACLLANASGCFLKVICTSGCLQMDELRGFIHEALCESASQKDILIVVAGLATLSNDVRMCTNRCRLQGDARPRRLSVLLCVQRPNK